MLAPYFSISFSSSLSEAEEKEICGEWEDKSEDQILMKMLQENNRIVDGTVQDPTQDEARKFFQENKGIFQRTNHENTIVE